MPLESFGGTGAGGGAGGSFLGARLSPKPYYGPSTITFTATAVAMATNQVSYAPANWPGLVVDRLRIEVTVAAAGNCRLGIYSNNNGLPGVLLAQGTAEVSTGTISATLDASFPAIILPDWCWYSCIFSAAPTLRAGTVMSPNPLGQDAFVQARRSIRATLTYGPLPTTADLTGIQWNDAFPLILAHKS